MSGRLGNGSASLLDGSRKMADVFISYSKRRRRLTSALAKDLNEAGFSVWWDTSLLPHQKFRPTIDAQLDTCKAAIIVWTPESINSDWVLAEAEHARSQSKLINTYSADLDAGKIPKPFNQVHAVELADRASIVAAVEQLVRRPRRQDWAPPRRRRLGLSSAVIAAVAFLILIWAGVSPRMGTSPGPAPVWDIQRDTFVGERVLLKWKYPARPEGTGSVNAARAPSFFEIESAKDNQFSDPKRRPERVNGEYTYVSGINASLYWRVRAVDAKNGRALSPWSVGALVTQYDSAYGRITHTGKALVYVSNSEYQDIFKWLDKSATLRGFDIALARAVTARLAVRTNAGAPIEAEFIPIPWSELLEAPRQGRADMIISAISKRKQREQAYGLKFSDTYFCTGQSLMYIGDPSNRTIRSMIAGNGVGYQTKTTSEHLVVALAEEPSLRIRPEGFDRTEFIVEALRSSRVQFAVVDTPFAIDAARTSHGHGGIQINYKEFAMTEFPAGFSKEEQTDEYAIAVRAGEEQLVREINAGLGSLKASGALAELFETERRDHSAAKGTPRGAPQNDSLRSRPWECRQ